MSRRLDVPHSQSGCNGYEINLLSVPGIETQFLCYPAHNLATILTAISRIPYLTIIHDKYRIYSRNLRTFFLFWPLKNPGA